MEARSQWNSVMQAVNYSIGNCNYKILFLKVRNFNGISMALMEFRWQYCHTKFIIKLQDVISTSQCIKLLCGGPSSCHDEINGSILNVAVCVLIFLRTSGRYT